MVAKPEDEVFFFKPCVPVNGRSLLYLILIFLNPLLKIVKMVNVFIIIFTDLGNLYRLVRLKPLKENMIGIRRVVPTDSVQVNSKDTLTSDMLTLHFENPKRFGNDIEVLSVRFEQDYIVVKFSDKKGNFSIFSGHITT